MRDAFNTRCPNCGARTIPLLAKAGVSAREPVDCPACGIHVELGAVWGWVLAVAAPTLFSVVFIGLYLVVHIVPALLLTLLISTVGYVVLVWVAPLHVAPD